MLIDPNDPAAVRAGTGYGVTDYSAICTTTIDPMGRSGGPCSTPIAIYRNCLFRTDGLLKQSMTRLAEVTDGLSQTIAVAEDAGRDARFIGEYSEYYVTPACRWPVRCRPGSGDSGAGRAGQRDRLLDGDQQQGDPQPREQPVSHDGDHAGQQRRGRRRDLWIPPRGRQCPVRRRVGQVHQGEPQHRRAAIAHHAQRRRGGIGRLRIDAGLPGDRDRGSRRCG